MSRLAGWLRALAIAGALLATACADRGDKPVELRFWLMGREAEVVSQLLPEFERRNPGIRVAIQQLPWTAAHEKLLTAFAGDALPDLCQLGNTWVPELAELGALEPLDSRVASSREIRRDDYFAGIWDTNRIDGVLRGIPWYVDTRLIYYRQDILAQAGFDHAPRSWDEWAREMRAVKAHVGPARYAILFPLNEFEPLLALSLQGDNTLLADGGRTADFHDPAFTRALAFYVDAFRNRWAPEMSNTQVSNVWTEFGRGFFSFYVSGPWNIAEFRKRLPPERQRDWMTAPLPGPHGPGASNAGGSSLVVIAGSRHKDAAWKLIEYLSQPAVQERFHALTGDLPPRRSTWALKSLVADPYASAFRDQLERVRPTPAVPEWERIANEMQLVAEQVVRGAIPIGEAPAELDRRVDAMLEKRRWMLDRKRP
ncbi:MAG TPA: sugar ABC transporter substrate-binding protein [Usitatibacter sp.]|jgi:multiple sugar transport system substrate-binding protein|nr:sugar ABC transporter substrate-binding protein [Usitatibacter sp.]